MCPPNSLEISRSAILGGVGSQGHGSFLGDIILTCPSNRLEISRSAV